MHAGLPGEKEKIIFRNRMLVEPLWTGVVRVGAGMFVRGWI
jgi:hypothetical protein